ncbi:MAG TPA: hypothetical protein VN933_00755 [Candidatus Eremiobacteraceae bacterium]|nr:hypothetical protein [Candidatus Eremiobacteraceae bacterium]
MRNPSRRSGAFAPPLIGLSVLLVSSFLIYSQVANAASPPQGNQGAGFLGQWCAQGDPNKQTSITSNGGVFFNLTNEQGDTSPGTLQGPNVISAPGWQFVTGTLTPDGSQINWSNGTYWQRCNNGGGGGGWRRPRIEGTWYRSGNRSQRCAIRRRGDTYTLTNEASAHATGSWDSRRQLTTNWSGTIISGIVTNGGNRINWDNGTFWTR